MDLGSSAYAASDVGMLHVVAQGDVMFEVPELFLRVCFYYLDLLTNRAAYPVVHGQLCQVFCRTSVSRHLLRRHLDFAEPNSMAVSYMVRSRMTTNDQQNDRMDLVRWGEVR